MPHLKCLACQVRVSGAAAARAGIGAPCPSCGRGLLPVGALREIVGFRSLAVSFEDDLWIDVEPPDDDRPWAGMAAMPRPPVR